MPQSAFTRFWNTVRPPLKSSPPAVSSEVVALRRRQRRLVMITAAVGAAVAASVATYSYISGAPQRADQEYQEGMRLMGPGKYPDAVVHFTRALSIYQQLPDAYLERGNAHRILGEPDAAIADYRAAADLNPSLGAAHNGIAMIFLERQDTQHALEELNKSITLQPTVDAYYQRGQILESQGKHQQAIEDYNRAIAEQPDAPFMYLARALAKANLGDQDGAHEDRAAADHISGHH